jgi:hypothetical protein
MLISHQHRFIYMKTLKTGGTSVEIYFERYCVDPSKEFQERHEREAEVSKWGIVGARQYRAVGERRWYNHMPAGLVLAQIGPELWSDYYKFCVIRNPFDKLVSSFWHALPGSVRLELAHTGFDTVRNRFEEWLETTDHPMDRNIFTIRDQPVMDRFVRYEELERQLALVCQDLKLPWDPSRLGRFKSGARLRSEPYGEYYTQKGVRRVQELYRWELENFRYPSPG